MKKHFNQLNLLKFLFLLFISNSIQSQVLWHGDPNKSINTVFSRFDSGNYPQDACSGGDGTQVSTAGTVNDPVHGKVWRIFKPKKRKRGEFARTSFIPSNGQTLYYGWRWKIEATPNITGGIAVFQWKTDAGGGNNTQNYPLNMGYGGGKLSMNAYGPCYPNWNSCSGSINNRMINLWNKPVNEGEWVTIVLKLKLSTNKDVGEVELWFNGEKQTLSNAPANDYSINLSADKKTAYHKTFDGAVTYPKWGAYNGEACNYEVYTYFDEMRIGTTLASVLDPLQGNSNPIIAVSSVSLTPESVSLNPGQTKQLSASVSPSNATNKSVSYTSSNTSIVTVNSSGLVTAIAAGNAIITVKTADGNKTDTCAVTINAINNTNTPPKVSITSPTNNSSMNQGTNITITASASDANGSVSKVEFFSDSTKLGEDTTSPYTFTISNPAIGTYNLTAKATDNLGASTTSSVVKITVNGINSPTNCKFGTPTSSILPSIEKTTFEKLYVYGNSNINVSNFKKFQINWNVSTNSLIQFAYSTNNGSPSYYIDLRDKITQNFKSSNPGVTITNSGVTGLDGSYWVTIHDNSFVMVSKTSGYTLYFSNAGLKPTCSETLNRTISNLATTYPNPAHDYLTVSKKSDQIAKASIYDLQGNLLIENSIDSKDSKIDINNLDNGIYILIIQEGEMIERKTISVKK